jgi:hypothetical protein
MNAILPALPAYEIVRLAGLILQAFFAIPGLYLWIFETAYLQNKIYNESFLP